MNEEIQEQLAEIENRVSFLENSLPGSAMSYHPEDEPPRKEPTPEKPWSKKQWDIINQLQAEVRHLHKEVYSLGRGGEY